MMMHGTMNVKTLKIPLFLLYLKSVYFAVFSQNFISINVSRFYPFSWELTFRFRIEELAEPVRYMLIFLKISGSELF
jgi:hypothetical protein